MASIKKNILILTSEFPPLPGGIGNHAYNMAEFLSMSGYNVNVIADHRDTKKNELAFDSSLKSKVYRISLNRLRFIMYFNRIIKCLYHVKKCDVLICSGKFPLWLGALISKFISIETIAVIHGTEVNFSSTYLKKSINKSLQAFDKVIAVSNYTKDLVKDLRLKHITVIPNGYNASDWDSTQSGTVHLKGYPKLLTVGNVTERKGQANVIRHLPELIKKFPDIHYHCVGFKTEIDVCLRLVEQLQIRDYVTFHGHVSHDELKAFYSKSDICVMLSEETVSGDVEGFGIALIEANHFGIPTIGAKDCGIEDAIANGVSGLLINVNDKKAMNKSIETILENYTEFKKGAKTWANKHKWNTIIKTYIDTIEH